MTGRGSVIGSPIAPLIKATGNTRTFERLREDMDFNAGRVLTGELSIADAARTGRPDRRNRRRPTEPSRSARRTEYFLIYKHPSTSSLEAGCHA